jgi:hypothetical protein
LLVFVSAGWYNEINHLPQELMTKLTKNHPFILTARKLEFLEIKYGITDEVVEERVKLKEKYPEYFEEYMKAKKIKEHIKLCKEKVVREIQMRERGCETVSYYKIKNQERKEKNRLKK